MASQNRHVDFFKGARLKSVVSQSAASNKKSIKSEHGHQQHKHQQYQHQHRHFLQHKEQLKQQQYQRHQVHQAEKGVKGKTAEIKPDDDDNGAAIAEAIKAAARAGECEDESFVAGRTYRDPAPLKWKIFEAVAGTNGQRAFAAYWSALRDYLRGWISRDDLDEKLVAALGEQNAHLHNELIMCLLQNSRCKYLPAEMIAQVPAHLRAKVVHVTEPRSHAVAPSHSTKSSMARSFQGKRKEGLLPAEAESEASTQQEHAISSTQGATTGTAWTKSAAPDIVKLERQDGGDSRACSVHSANGETPDNLAAGRALPPMATGTCARETRRGEHNTAEDQLLGEIEHDFGARSDLWVPWSDGTELSGRKRGAPLSNDLERKPKSFKQRDTRGIPAQASTFGSPGENLSALLAAESAGYAAQCYRAERIPGARALAPFLQAVAASQHMKVSHEVCRVMTAGVKEYVRRIIVACLASTRDRGKRANDCGRTTHETGAKGTASARVGSVFTARGGTMAASEALDSRQVDDSRQSVLTPGHLRVALETTPRLAGPHFATRAQWRKVVAIAVELPGGVGARQAL